MIKLAVFGINNDTTIIMKIEISIVRPQCNILELLCDSDLKLVSEIFTCPGANRSIKIII